MYIYIYILQQYLQFYGLQLWKHGKLAKIVPLLAHLPGNASIFDFLLSSTNVCKMFFFIINSNVLRLSKSTKLFFFHFFIINEI